LQKAYVEQIGSGIIDRTPDAIGRDVYLRKIKKHNKEDPMVNQKDRKLSELSDKGKEVSKSFQNYLAQYDEEGDFLCGKVANSLSEFKEEE
jgi:hypothetical protein